MIVGMTRRSLVAVLAVLAACGPAPVARPAPGGRPARPVAVRRSSVRHNDEPEPAAPTAPVPEIRTGGLEAALGRQSKGLRASVGVYDAVTGTRLYESGGDTPRRPASVMKVATTAAAMLALGPTAELSTEVLATSAPDAEGAVAGDLVVRGDGDPGINNRAGPGAAEAALHEMAKAVRAKVSRVSGDLVMDDTAFAGPMRHPGWNWDDGEWAWYMAPVSSLLLTDACVEVSVLPGDSEGAPGVVRMDPVTGAVRFVDKVVTAAAGQKKTNVVLGRSDGAGTIPVTGSVPKGSKGYSFDAACVDPAAHLGDVFLRVLRAEGVEVAGKVVVLHGPGPSSADRMVSADTSNLVPLARHATSVLDVVRIANKHSQNLYAELLLRAVARAKGGEGSFDGGCRAARMVLGFDDADVTFRQVDGSGLARENQTTVGALGKILVTMYGSPMARDYIASMPEPGDADGTLRRRMESPKFTGRVFAKTGTLRDTSALAGYVRAQSGRTFAFVVLCEGDVGRSRDLQDDVVEALVDQ
jgi:serine-type D-Ala-D-Ala carboxypeptidase/endopeptidase (penicillin-binding protein 4)